MRSMMWEEYYTGSIVAVDYTALIGYLRYCKEHNLNPVDKKAVLKQLIFIKKEIDQLLVDLYE